MVFVLHSLASQTAFTVALVIFPEMVFVLHSVVSQTAFTVALVIFPEMMFVLHSLVSQTDGFHGHARHLSRDAVRHPPLSAVFLGERTVNLGICAAPLGLPPLLHLPRWASQPCACALVSSEPFQDISAQKGSSK